MAHRHRPIGQPRHRCTVLSQLSRPPVPLQPGPDARGSLCVSHLRIVSYSVRVIALDKDTFSVDTSEPLRRSAASTAYLMQ
jgi:hypothetical protein